MGAIGTPFLNLDPTSSESLNASNIFYNYNQSIKQKLDTMEGSSYSFLKPCPIIEGQFQEVCEVQLEGKSGGMFITCIVNQPTYYTSKLFYLNLPLKYVNEWVLIKPLSNSSVSLYDFALEALAASNGNVTLRVRSVSNVPFSSEIYVNLYNINPIDIVCSELFQSGQAITPVKFYTALEGTSISFTPYQVLTSNNMESAIREIVNKYVLKSEVTSLLSNLTISLNQVKDLASSPMLTNHTHDVSKIENISNHPHSASQISDLNNHSHDVSQIENISNHDHALSSPTNSGLMSYKDKTKLDIIKFINGKLDPNLLPPIAIRNIHVLNSEFNMYNLVVQVGDVCIRTDIEKTFIVIKNPTSSTQPFTDSSHWQEMLVGISKPFVTHVNGQTGIVDLAAEDIVFKTTPELNFTNVNDILEFLNTTKSNIGHKHENLYYEKSYLDGKLPYHSVTTCASSSPDSEMDVSIAFDKERENPFINLTVSMLENKNVYEKRNLICNIKHFNKASVIVNVKTLSGEAFGDNYKFQINMMVFND